MEVFGILLLIVVLAACRPGTRGPYNDSDTVY
jgi:hypothetical protein